MKLTLSQIQNVDRDNLPTILHPDKCQIYSVYGIFGTCLYDEIHIFAPAFSEVQFLEI